MPVLSDTIGRPVVDEAGTRVGRLRDLAVRLDDPHPRVRELVVRGTDGTVRRLPWEAVVEFEEGGAVVRTGASEATGAGDDLLMLHRDVLDTQVFDVAGHAMARVGDVRLVRDGDRLRVAGVEVGMGSVLRRLGLRAAAARLRDDPVDWAGVHLASGRGHSLELSSPAGRVRRLTPGALAQLVARLPPDRGAEILGSLETGPAAETLSRQRPALGGRLVRALGTGGAAPIVAAMARDDATAALRHLDAARRDSLLEEVGSERAEGLRRLLAHPPSTAAGLMNPDVLRAPVDTSPRDLRALVADAHPRIDALLTVLLVDEEGRVTGAVPPREMLAGDCRAHRTPVVRADASLDDVRDVFATHDILALPVVDADDRLLGAIAVDDVMEELLASRLPGRRRLRLLRWRPR